MAAAAGIFVLACMHYSASLPLVASSWSITIILCLYIHSPFLTIINTHYPSGKIIFPYPMLLAMLVRMSVPLPWRDCSGASRKTNTSSTSHLILEPRGPRSKQDYILSSSCSRGFTLSQWQLFLSPAYQGFFCHIYDFMYSHTCVYVYLDTHAYIAYLGTGYSSI